MAKALSRSSTISSNHDTMSSVYSISNESSFYGDDTIKQDFEDRLQAQSLDFESIRDWNLKVQAAKNLKRQPEDYPGPRKRQKLDDQTSNNFESQLKSPADYQSAKPRNNRKNEPKNPDEGHEGCLQLNDNVSAFLDQLRPSNTEMRVPWIRCANFYAEHKAQDVRRYAEDGSELLDKFRHQRQKLEEKFDPPKPAASITRMMAGARVKLEAEIKRTARTYGVVCGKWMLFPTAERVDVVWAKVVKGTVEGRLGIAAKVATKIGGKAEDEARLICIYTADFEDRKDIKRVLLEIVKMGLAEAVTNGSTGRQIWYKPDCYTHLDLMSGNEYKIKPSLYGTASLLTKDDLA